MSRLWTRAIGTGSGGYFLAGTDHLKATTHLIPWQYDIELAGLGSFCRGEYAGGSWTRAIDASAAGDVDLIDAVPFTVDNTNSQLSGATNLICRVTYYVRVSDAAVSLTPKILYGATFAALTTAATISGQAACTATAGDYSGTNAIQTVVFTLPAGVKYFKASLTIGGTPAAGLYAYAYAVRDLYIND